MPVPDMAPYGATLVDVARHARKHRYSPHVMIARIYGVPDEWAMEWIRLAQEAGYDVGKPRDDDGKPDRS